jgi:hypothetical protein
LAAQPGSTLLAAMQRAVNAGIVLVISAGNDGEANPDPFALTPAQHFPGMVIIAGSIGADNGSGGTDLDQISTFSNRAGSGAVHYLTALGYRDRAPDHTGTHYLWSGTSFSAPVISGAVALLAHAFPNLTGRQIVEILFKSADDLGAAGVDSVFGRGRLNIARAFQPIGTTSLADSKVAVSTVDNGDLPPAAGDANGGMSLGPSFSTDTTGRSFSISPRRCQAPTGTAAYPGASARRQGQQRFNGPGHGRDDRGRAKRPAAGLRPGKARYRTTGRAKGAAHRRLGNCPARRQDGYRLRLLRGRQRPWSGACPEWNRAHS